MQNSPSGPNYMERSYIIQRRGMALVAAALPLAFMLSSLFGRTAFQLSLSAYYWTLDCERNLFVGVLCSVAVFLILYKGQDRKEDLLLDTAGLSALGVAFFPLTPGSDCNGGSFSAHGFFAVLFFICIFVVCIFMSRKSLKSIPDENKRAYFQVRYDVCSGVMIGSVALAVLARSISAEFVRTLCEYHAIFWFETFGIWSFSAYWYIKSRELDPGMTWIPFRRRKEA